MKVYDTMPDGTEILHIYHEYMDGRELVDRDKELLLHFLHEIVGCVNLTWKEKSLKGEQFSKLATSSDEAFAVFVMMDYHQIPQKKQKAKDKLLGARLDHAMEFSMIP